MSRKAVSIVNMLRTCLEHLECTRIMLMAPCAKIPMLSKKSPRVSKVKSLCTREFVVNQGGGLRVRGGQERGPQQHLHLHPSILTQGATAQIEG